MNPTLLARSSPPRPVRHLAVPDGWLCFESDAERRRLTPIPLSWETADEKMLQQLWSSAEVVPPTALRRLRIPGQA